MTNILKQYSDSELIYMIRCGSNEAFQMLYERYENIISKYVSTFINNANFYGIENEDIIQECLMTFYNVLLCFIETKGAFYTYVIKSIRYRLYALIKELLSPKNNGFNHSTAFLTTSYNESYLSDYKYIEDFPSINEETHPLNSYMVKETIEGFLGEDSLLDEDEKQIISLKLMGYTLEEIALKVRRNRRQIEYALRIIKLKIKEKILL